MTATEEHRFPCDACGADMRFAPGGDRLECDHCGATQTIDEAGPWDGAVKELDFRAAIQNLLPLQEMEETRVSHCPSCAAEVEFDPAQHAAECPFCATPVVTDTGTHRHIKPRGVLPFALDDKQASDAMRAWLGSLWFAPNGLKAYARQGKAPSGIYVPYWTFDARTQTRYDGQRGTKYTVKSGKRTVTKIRWRRVAGRVARAFDDVLVLASQSLPKRYTDALEPWDLSAMEPYRPEYLAGFRAEGYQIDLDTGFQAARVKMDAQIRRDIKFDIGGDRQRIDRVDTQISDVTFKHVLLPVWLAAYKYRGETYRFVVNGRTGRVQGERPWSAWKIAFAVLVGLIVAAGLGYVVAMEELASEFQ